MDNSGVVLMQHGHTTNSPPPPAHAHPPTHTPRAGNSASKKATFAQLPGETTWRQTQRNEGRVEGGGGDGGEGSGGAGDNGTSPSQVSVQFITFVKIVKGLGLGRVI